MTRSGVSRRKALSRAVDVLSRSSANVLGFVLNAVQHREQERLAKAQTAACKEGRLTDEEGLALLQKLKQQEQTRQGISAPMEG